MSENFPAAGKLLRKANKCFGIHAPAYGKIITIRRNLTSDSNLPKEFSVLAL
jgi:hypothetical protein